MAKKKTNGSNNDQRYSAEARKQLRSLPSVSSLLENDEVVEWLHGLPRSVVRGALQFSLDSARNLILGGETNFAHDLQSLLAVAEEELLRRAMPSMTQVINASGIVLHTGLGRAPLCDAAIEAIAETASGYCNLEYDLDTGGRGKRTAHVVDILVELTGAESATVVNNNAAATLLILRTFASGREVIVSRGQLIEIGGSFRLPDIMSASGATLREVGTTNRTRLEDFENAIGESTGMLFRAHPSNYRVVGFTEEVAIAAMAQLAHQHDLIAVDDIGSGALFDSGAHGLPPEPGVRDSVQAGADLICFSGDKLLGGPQCGLIIGRRDLIEELNAHPLMRTYRVGKLTLAALEVTLRAFRDPDYAFSTIPTLAMLAASTETLAANAQKLCDQLEAVLPNEHFFACSDVAFAGGGAMPGQEVPTVVVQWRPATSTPQAITHALRDGDPPVVARIRDEAICFDLRTIADRDLERLVAAVSAAVWSQSSDPEDTETSLPVLE